MTNGIIQIVIKKHKLSTHNSDYRMSVNDYNMMLSRIQRELIEEIKKTCDISDLDDDAYWVIRQIIGDNSIKEIEKEGMKNEKEQSEKLWREYE